MFNRTTTVTTALAAAGVLAVMGSASAKSNLTAFDKMFMNTAAQGGMFEVMSSQLALKKSHNSGVRAVAQRMVKEHSQANADLKLVAKNEDVSLPKSPNSAQRATYASLSRLSGSSFDKAYMKAQVKAHDNTVALFKQENAKGQDTAARSFATKYLPTIQDHTIMIHNVASAISADPSARKNMKASMKTGGMSGM